MLHDRSTRLTFVQRMRRAMFSEPLLAHRAETRGVHATWHPHPGNDDQRDQRRNDADDKQHRDSRRREYHHPDTRHRDCLCACAQGLPWLAFGRRRVAAPSRVHVHFGTARFNAVAYTGDMQHVSITTIFAILWVITVSIAGIAGNVSSPVSWAILAAVAVVPPLALMRRRHDARQSMSQRIQEALR
jgi:Flp pilus assembly protein TadB